MLDIHRPCLVGAVETTASYAGSTRGHASNEFAFLTGSRGNPTLFTVFMAGGRSLSRHLRPEGQETPVLLLKTHCRAAAIK